MNNGQVDAWGNVPEEVMSVNDLQTYVKSQVRGSVAVSDKAETKSKCVDIIYSGRGMPFRVVLSSLYKGGRR